MSDQIKRWNVPRGTTVSESPHGEFYHCADFDTLAQRLQEAERLLRRVIGYEHGPTLDAMIEAFLAGKGDKT